MNRKLAILNFYFILWIVINQNCFSQTNTILQTPNDTTIDENIAKKIH